jgi:hypothetical protein
MVDVLMPFSAGESYAEPLVPLDSLNKRFKAAGFEVIEKIDNQAKIDGISSVDQFYAKLYSGCALKLT